MLPQARFHCTMLTAFCDTASSITAASFHTKKLSDFVRSTNGFSNTCSVPKLSSLISANHSTEILKFNGDFKILDDKSKEVEEDLNKNYFTGDLTTIHSSVNNIGRSALERNDSKLADSLKNKTNEELIEVVNKYVTKKKKSKKPISTSFINEFFKQTENLSEQNEVWDATEMIIKTKRVTFIQTRNLMEKLRKEIMISALLTCFKYLNGIPEKEIVQNIKFFLTLDNNEFANYKRQFVANVKNSEFAANSAKRLIITRLCNIPICKQIARNCLKELTINEIIEFLKVLFNALQIYKKSPNNDISNLLLWIELILDTHCTQLLITNEVHPLLSVINRFIKNEYTTTEKIGELMPYISTIEKAQEENTKIAQDDKNTVYCIKVLSFH